MEKASKSNNYHYNHKLKNLALANKRNMTKSAACMWKYVLGNKQMLGYQFRRERPILNFIADFVCLEILLIVEVDGFTHDDSKANKKDRERDKKLTDVGFTVLRFSS
jgi:very-short-patch-repair endonuclease